MPQKQTDQQLVELALRNPQGFRFLMQRYEKPLFFYIRRISSFSVEEAEDVLQEVFIKVYKNLNGYDSKLKFSSWIYRITHNEVISKFRKVKVRPKQISFDVEDSLLNVLAADFDIEYDIDINIFAQKISQLLFELDDKYREVIILRYFEQKDYSEISDILKKPAGSVASLLNRAKKKLKEKIIEKNIKF